jgi:hypothetical protein
MLPAVTQLCIFPYLRGLPCSQLLTSARCCTVGGVSVASSDVSSTVAVLLMSLSCTVCTSRLRYVITLWHYHATRAARLAPAHFP